MIIKAQLCGPTPMCLSTRLVRPHVLFPDSSASPPFSARLSCFCFGPKPYLNHLKSQHFTIRLTFFKPELCLSYDVNQLQPL